MYLLNQYCGWQDHILYQEFTFHYVSIKSKVESTYTEMGGEFTFHYVSIKSVLLTEIDLEIYKNLHSTMYLLNLTLRYRNRNQAFIFTFHYVSIKSHSRKDRNRHYNIYIPLCIY